MSNPVDHPRAYLKLSSARKVAPLNSNNESGSRALIRNAFGLPAKITCPGMTKECGKVCYAAKLEGIRPTVRGLVGHNWDALKDADFTQTYRLLVGLMEDFRYEVKQGVRKYGVSEESLLKFRIHWDGDFYSSTYADAWTAIIQDNPDITFWAYTRSELTIIKSLVNCTLPNLNLWLSVDQYNVTQQSRIKDSYPHLRMAFLASTFEESKDLVDAVNRRVRVGGERYGVKCPAETKRIPMVTDKGEGACIACNLCLDGGVKNNVRFSITRK